MGHWDRMVGQDGGTAVGARQVGGTGWWYMLVGQARMVGQDGGTG